MAINCLHQFQVYVAIKTNGSRLLKRSVICYFYEKHVLRLFLPSSSQYVSTIPEEKNCRLLTFQNWTVCKGLYGENDGPSV